MKRCQSMHAACKFKSMNADAFVALPNDSDFMQHEKSKACMQKVMIKCSFACRTSWASFTEMKCCLSMYAACNLEA